MYLFFLRLLPFPVRSRIVKFRARKGRAVVMANIAVAQAAYRATAEAVAFTPTEAREAHDNLMAVGNTALAAQIERCIPQGGKVMLTSVDRTRISKARYGIVG